MALSWQLDTNMMHVINFPLDAHSEDTRIAQLRVLTAWVQEHVGTQDMQIFGGDCNFTVEASERESSRRTPWRPSNAMSTAWASFLRHCRAQVAEQPEMTWSRFTNHPDGSQSHCLAMLDVVGTNAQEDHQWKAIARRCD